MFSQISAQQILQNPNVPVEKIETYADRAKEAFFYYAPKIGIALLVLFIGLWLINLLVRGINRIMLARDVDPTLRPFLKTITSIALKLMLFLTVAGMIGIETTSFVAALGAAGLAIGLALQGSLSNFAGGVLILLFKPFRVNDTIEAQGHVGTVKEIQILYTILVTADNKKVIIPNGNLSNNDVVNYTAMENRRLDLKINVAYHADLQKAKAILFAIIDADERILKEPIPQIGVSMLADTGVNLSIMVWLKRENYGNVQFYIYESAKMAFEKEGIDMPVVLVETQRIKV
ncbi:MAG: mechanosensitive ion channel [Sphingobacteriales bacterium]|nr:MAG: mechanosensitive ion channel [Sphingobacteriales bacterium]